MPPCLSKSDVHQFSALKEKVVVLTGGASGIGAATTSLLYNAGAHVVFGDIDQQTGAALVSMLLEKYETGKGSVMFIPCNVTSYRDIYSLFRCALEKHERVDHALACAGIVDNPRASYFDSSLDIDTVGQDQGDQSVINVNFLGTCAFSRIALPFLRHGRQNLRTEDRSLTLLSSVTGFRDAPGMFLYQTSKVATLGLMRSMRSSILSRDGIRVNSVCPGMTESGLTASFIHLFQNAKPELPAHHQTSGDVAYHICTLMATDDLNGKSIYIEGGKGWEFEDGLAREMRSWLGEEPTKLSDENLAFIESLGGI